MKLFLGSVLVASFVGATSETASARDGSLVHRISGSRRVYCSDAQGKRLSEIGEAAFQVEDRGPFVDAIQFQDVSLSFDEETLNVSYRSRLLRCWGLREGGYGWYLNAPRSEDQAVLWIQSGVFKSGIHHKPYRNNGLGTAGFSVPVESFLGKHNYRRYKAGKNVRVSVYIMHGTTWDDAGAFRYQDLGHITNAGSLRYYYKAYSEYVLNLKRGSATQATVVIKD